MWVGQHTDQPAKREEEFTVLSYATPIAKVFEYNLAGST